MKSTIHRGLLPAFLITVILGCCPVFVHSQELQADSLVNERINVIREMLENGKKGANRWWYGWLAGYSAATLAQGAVAISAHERVTREDMGLGAFTTLLGAAGQLIAPMTPGTAPGKLRKLSEGSYDNNLKLLQEAEKLLEESARREMDGRSWKTHAIDGAVNIGCGFIVWYGFKRSFMAGAGNIALNTAICEAQIFTQPVRAIKDYNTYCKKYKPLQSLGYEDPVLNWYFTLVPGGIGIKMTF